MGYLDNAGLSRFTAWVRSRLSGKQDALTPDGSITLQGGNIGVALPSKAVTKAEYDALTEAEKQAEVIYAVTDDAPGGSGGSAEEVYSTEETRIGTWIDGKPLYRKVYQVTHEQKKDENETIPLDTDIDVDTLCAAYGSMRNKSFGSFYSFPYAEVYSGSNFADAFLISNSGDRAITLVSHYWSNYTLEFFVTVEYTKTTDEGGAAG